jgi:hypothetical protein
MSKITVTWGRRAAIGPDLFEEVRSMERSFGTARLAAEFAADIVFMIEGREHTNAWSDKFYMVGRDRPRVQYDNAARNEWVEVEYCPLSQQGVG